MGAFGERDAEIVGGGLSGRGGEVERNPQGGVHVAGVVGGVEAHHGVGVEALRGAVREAQLGFGGVVQVDGRGNQVVVLVRRRVDEETAEVVVDHRLPRVAGAGLDPPLVEGVAVVDAEDGLPFHGGGEAH